MAVDCWAKKGKEKDNGVNFFLWEPNYVEKFKNTTRKKITNNGWETKVRHCTLNTTRKT